MLSRLVARFVTTVFSQSARSWLSDAWFAAYVAAADDP